MKNLVLIIPILLTIPAYATTMCAKNDSVAVVLDPTIGSNGGTGDSNLGTWKITFPYGYVSGISACLNSKYGKSVGGWVENLTDVNPDGIERTVNGSEKYGRYCWCKATHPVASCWVLAYEYGNSSDCAAQCGSGWGSCIQQIRGVENMRTGLFGSISN